MAKAASQQKGAAEGKGCDGGGLCWRVDSHAASEWANGEDATHATSSPFLWREGAMHPTMPCWRRVVLSFSWERDCLIYNPGRATAGEKAQSSTSAGKTAKLQKSMIHLKTLMRLCTISCGTLLRGYFRTGKLDPHNKLPRRNRNFPCPLPILLLKRPGAAFRRIVVASEVK